MASYRIECLGIDSALALETFPTRGQAECVAGWVYDMESFCNYSIAEVDGPATTNANEWLQYSGHPGYPGPCPDGVGWGDWLAQNNVD